MLKNYLRNLGLIVVLGIILNGCTQLIIDEYEAIALTSLTWRVEYYIGDNDKRSRWEEFSSASLENINGERPVDAFGEADDQGLWWPRIPTKPTINEIEARQKTGESHNRPEMLREVSYSIAYNQGGRLANIPTHYPVYRQAVKAIQSGQSLKLILRVDDQFIEKAEPI
ncbi:hypothetical protein [Gloeocapsa sp. PCC 73106]|uniref:hypothetical protein n=1 Tax=Gloeocapsa sp. PCC 73106 TaxID=102232 RepID=UPI0002AC1935|nr:hypothetical protein [Gloeocapsa sp. PCC 73106]ELR98040.1 hypothetical protein GLO73106DRAFT_00018610 [Gloeocapsa sp. PCC 73106]